MTKYSSIAIAACLGAVSLTPSVARSSATTLALNCMPYWPTGVGLVYTGTTASSADYSSPTEAICPIDVDHDVGSSIQFRVIVKDRSSTDNFSCFGEAFNVDGVSQGVTAPANSSGSSGNATTLTMSLSGVNPGSDWTFSVKCHVPDAQSEIVTLRVRPIP